MLGITVQPNLPQSAVLRDLPEPDADEGTVLVRTVAVGICGTDVEILQGKYGESPQGDDFLVLGHECLGTVLAAPPETNLLPDDLVVPMVRHPDPVPCPNCAIGEWDMCRNGRYTEHGIKQRHGFMRERFRTTPDRLVKLDRKLGQLGVLLEPGSVLAKAWDHIERIGRRARWEPRQVLVTGAGPIGLLAALMARQRGFDVAVLDIVTEGPKPALVADLGGRYFTGGISSIDHVPEIALECTGVSKLVFDVMQATTPGGIVCLTGVSTGGREISVDVGSLNRSMVLENDVVFGSVNANRRHYEAAAQSLAKADAGWLQRLITRQVPLDNWQSAFVRQPGDVKVILDFQV